MARGVIFYALIFMAGSAIGQSKGSKSPPNAAEQATAFNAIRAYALSYTQRLPNYTCTQTTRQTFTPVRPSGSVETGPLRTDVFEEQLSFIDHREIRKVMRINGRPVSEARDQIMTTFSRGEFGNLLDVIFEPETHADIQWNHLATRNGRRLYVFAFRVPQSKGYVLTESIRRIRVPFQGFVFADAHTLAVVRIEMKCIGIPANSEYKAADLTLDYKAAQVAGQDFILPSHFELHYRTNQVEQTNDAVYSAYHRFSTDATVTFDGR